jgi:hypothetical protein
MLEHAASAELTYSWGTEEARYFGDLAFEVDDITLACRAWLR